MPRPPVRLRPTDDGLVLEEFSIYETYWPLIWNKVLPMTDLAIHVLEPNRRLDAIDRKILMVLEEDPAAGSRRGDPAPGRSGGPEQDRARYFGFCVGRERRSFGRLAAKVRRCGQRDARGDGVLSDGGRRRLHAARRGCGHAELRRVLQEADRRGATEECHVAFRDGEDQVGHRVAGAGGVSYLDRVPDAAPGRLAVRRRAGTHAGRNGSRVCSALFASLILRRA